MAQSEAEKANAAFYDEQAEFARQAGLREQEVFEDQSNEFMGRQISQAGAGGVELSGSALLAFGDSKLRQIREVGAIKFDSAAKVREALLKAGASRQAAERITSWENMFLPPAGQALGTATQVGLGIARNDARSSE
jgi:hypothetical protein